MNSCLPLLEENAAPVPEDADQAVFEDAEFFRRLNNTRKSKAEKFLQNKSTSFQLLCTLTLASVLAPMVRLLFSIHERTENKVERPDSNQQKRARKRAFFKGPMVEVAQSDVKHLFSDVNTYAARAINQLWSGEVFQVANLFWPADEPKANLFERLVSERLLNISQIKWRISARFLVAPFNVCWVEKYESLDELSPPQLARFEASMAELLEASPCCLDPFLAVPLQKVLKNVAEVERKQTYFRAVKGFMNGFRPASLREEQCHAVQRRIAGGFTATCRTFPQQASACVIATAAANFRSFGGRCLQKADPRIQQAAKRARVKRVIHKRPNQTGNTLLYFVAKQRQQGCMDPSFQALSNQWKNMSAESKQVWVNRHKCEIKRRRRQDAQARALAQPDLAQSKTPWNIGDADFPLKLTTLEAFLAPFRSKRSGLNALASFGGSGKSEWHQDCLDYKKQVEEGKIKYHSMNAATLASKSVTTFSVSDGNLADVPTAHQIMRAPCPPHHCFSKHPGACASKHQREIISINKMVKTLGREGSVLRWEVGRARGKKVVYVKLTVGGPWAWKLWFGLGIYF